MRLILLASALVCGAAGAQTTGAIAVAGDGAEWTVYSDVALWRASDPVPVSQIEDDWTGYSPRSGRNTILQRNRAAIGVEKNRWRVGLEFRQDASITTDRATLDALYMYQQRQKPVPPAAFALQGRYFVWQAQGLRVGHTFDGPQIAGRKSSVEVSAAVYGKQRLRETSVSGTLSYPEMDSYGFDASRHEANSRNTYLFMDKDPSASGASVSFAATVPLADAWTLRMQADDIASRLRWKDLPVTEESLNSNVTSYDADGYLNYRPLLSGRNQQVDRTFKIPRYTAAALDYQDKSWGATLHVARYAGETIPTLSLSRRFGWLTVRSIVETRFHTAGFGLEAGNFRFLLQSDTLNLNESKAQALQLHYHLAW